MPNPWREEWLHGPDADPDPVVAEAVALVTEYQLGMFTELEQAAFEQRLRSDTQFAAAAEPMLFAARVVREHLPVQDIPALTRSAKRSSLPKRGWIQRHPTVWRIAAAIVCALVIIPCANSAYGAIVRSKLPPASVTFNHAPLSVVMDELRRRYHLDVEVCDVGFDQDSVTMTLKDAPVDDVVEEIAQQTLRIPHWLSPYTLRFQPQPDLPRGWGYNARLILRHFTTLGCHR